MIYIVLGTRAQLIKMAPLMRELERRGASMRFLLTGQHRETMQDLIEDFALRTPAERVYGGDEASGKLTMARWLAGCLWQLVVRRRHWFPRRSRADVLVVHGDTFSTLLGALVGRVLGIPVAHVESGLRSFNWRNPFPEELTRLAVFRLATFALCPGAWAAANLAGYRHLRVVDTGQNTLLEAVAYARERHPPESAAAPYYVVSAHRFENLYSAPRRDAIVRIVSALARRGRVIMVLHPMTERMLRRHGQLDRLRAAGVELRPRMTYTRFLALLAGAEAVLTDGGSNQEELSYLGVRTVLLREATERREGLGRNVMLAGVDEARVEAALLAPLPPRAPWPPARPSAVIADALAFAA